jgi:hypothetical protein
MNERIESTCTCQNCQGPGCTCGCQVPAVNNGCACGAQCNCGPDCACDTPRSA